MSRFRRVVFEDTIDGSRPCLAPNGYLLAYANKGTEVTFLGLNQDDRDDDDDGGRQHSHRLELKGRYVALDEVTDLLWSPDSTMIAVWMEARRTIEIVSANTLSTVARIDGGLNGLRQLMWHPSSRCLYWFGLAQSHAVDLTDGTTMVFDNPVKVVPPLGFSAWAMSNRSLMMPTVTHENSDKRRALCSTALMSISNDSQYVFTVSPCTVASAQRSSARHVVSVNSLDPHDATTWQRDVAAEVERINAAAADETLSVSTEKLHVYCAMTHEELYTIPIRWPTPLESGGGDGNVMANMVTDFRVTSACIALFDQAATRLLLLSLDGERVLGDYHDIAAFAASPDGGSVLLLDVKSTRLIVLSCVYGRMYRVGDIPLSTTHLPVHVPVLSETTIEAASPFPSDEAGADGEDGSSSVPRATYTVSDGDDALLSWERYTASEIARLPTNSIFAKAYHAIVQRQQQQKASSTAEEAAGPRLDPALAACAAVAAIHCSPCGKYAAVVSPHLPTTLFVVDVVESAQVRAVMRHHAPVEAVEWRPALAQAPPALAFTTDSHSGNVFIWTPECAMCLSAPLKPLAAAPRTKSVSTPRGKSAYLTDGKNSGAASVSAAFNRLVWGAASSNTLLLVDDLQQLFVTCELRH